MNILLILWILFLVITGLVLFTKMMKKYQSGKVVKKWDKVTGYITHIYSNDEWCEITGKIPQTGSIMVRYSYKYSGMNYSSSSIFLNSDSTVISSNDKEGQVYKRDIPGFIKSIQKKPEVCVWVNPFQPKQSVLVDTSNGNLTAVLMGLVVIIWALCITLIYSDAFRENIGKKVTVLEIKEGSDY